ncbi:type III secretion system chaperone [Xenorhabdus bovienii]|uniref:type III secretion system chaperone n=1 Tax=Xenorhabdus bovienii TaxID=40576 RepID=UPI0023B28BD1|nr:type III secretion system chaperone [Xenorhabdus bovienii]MDE9518056.1 type III secretion system chaperone [Xenorhabdus bovienii]
MNKEEIINTWLAGLSGGQWQLLNNECNLVDEDGLHYASIINDSNRMVVMFPFYPSSQLEVASLYTRLLQLNAHPDVVGIAAFSLAADNSTVVLNLSLPDHTLFNCDLDEFWQNALSLRNALFQAISE